MRDTKLSHEDFRKEIHKVARELIQEFTKQLFDGLILEEREMYLEENAHTKGNGYYERNLITPQGEIKGLKVPRTRDGNFRPALLPPPRQKAMIDIGELITLLFVAGVSTRKINKILETWYGIHYSPSSIARLTKVTEEEIEMEKQTIRRDIPVYICRCHFLKHKKRSNSERTCICGNGNKKRLDKRNTWLLRFCWRRICLPLEGNSKRSLQERGEKSRNVHRRWTFWIGRSFEGGISRS